MAHPKSGNKKLHSRKLKYCLGNAIRLLVRRRITLFHQLCDYIANTLSTSALYHNSRRC